LAANGDGEIRKSVAAGENVAALGGIVRGAADLGVVGADDAVVDEQEGGAGVSNSRDGAGAGGATDGVAVGGELPEALAVVDGRVDEIAFVLGLINVLHSRQHHD
jgi:hypothetical protein